MQTNTHDIMAIAKEFRGLLDAAIESTEGRNRNKAVRRVFQYMYDHPELASVKGFPDAVRRKCKEFKESPRARFLLTLIQRIEARYFGEPEPELEDADDPKDEDYRPRIRKPRTLTDEIKTLMRNIQEASAKVEAAVKANPALDPMTDEFETVRWNTMARLSEAMVYISGDPAAAQAFLKVAVQSYKNRLLPLSAEIVAAAEPQGQDPQGQQSQEPIPCIEVVEAPQEQQEQPKKQTKTSDEIKKIANTLVDELHVIAEKVEEMAKQNPALAEAMLKEITNTIKLLAHVTVATVRGYPGAEKNLKYAFRLYTRQILPMYNKMLGL
jgi:hypothetical protein